MSAVLLADAPIDQRERLSQAEFVERYLNPHKPVIVKNALKHWSAIGKWTPEYLAEAAGEREFTVDGKRLTIAELVRQVRASTASCPAPYLRNTPVRDLSPGLLSDIAPIPQYSTPNWLDTRFRPRKMQTILGRAVIPDVFIGGAGKSFPFLHYDKLNSHAYLNQIYGTKLYTLYAPDQTPYIYRNPEIPNQSMVKDIENPDLERFPLFAKARAIQAVLEPGSLIFIPAGWWHTAKNLEPAITISISVVNASNWSGLIRDQFQNARSSRRFGARMAAYPLAAYLSLVGMYRSLRRDREAVPAV